MYICIGGVKPEVPINAFTTSIYRKEEDKVLYTHICEENKISEFVPIITEEEFEILEIKEQGKIFNIDDRPIYFYCFANGEYICGNQSELSQKLLPKLFDKELPLMAKLIISNFFKNYYEIDKVIKKMEEKTKGIRFGIDKSRYLDTDIEFNSIEKLKKYSSYLKVNDFNSSFNYFWVSQDKKYLLFNGCKININHIVQGIKKNHWLYELMIENTESQNIYNLVYNDTEFFTSVIYCEHVITKMPFQSNWIELMKMEAELAEDDNNHGTYENEISIDAKYKEIPEYMSKYISL